MRTQAIDIVKNLRRDGLFRTRTLKLSLEVARPAAIRSTIRSWNFDR